MGEELFPRGIATGDAFCNREAERGELARRLLERDHTWLAAPRRYGKTSLLHEVLIESRRRRNSPRVHGVVVDLLPAFDRTSVQDFVLDGVAELAVSILPARRRILDAANRFFAGLRPRVTLSAAGPRLELSNVGNNAQTVIEALTGLDAMAARESVRPVMVLDEFQRVAEVGQGLSLEAAVRHAVERSRHTTYVFSGSHRRLLAQMFNNASRPLYHLCAPMELGRIDESAYTEYLLERSRQRWTQPLSMVAIEKVLDLTERHPYYVNQLCRRLWRDTRAPTSDVVQQEWEELVKVLGHWLASSLEGLSRQQMAVLFALAESPTAEPTGREFLSRCRVPKSSASQALDVLVSRDHVYQDEDGQHRLVDPAMRWFFAARRVAVPR